MVALLPLSLLLTVASLFGLAWIVTAVDPTSAPWYFFAGFVGLVFSFVFGFLGLLLYFVRTRFYKRYSSKWYFKTSFKMAFFVALFVGVVTGLAILQLLTTLNIFLAILAISLFGLFSYLGKKE